MCASAPSIFRVWTSSYPHVYPSVHALVWCGWMLVVPLTHRNYLSMIFNTVRHAHPPTPAYFTGVSALRTAPLLWAHSFFRTYGWEVRGQEFNRTAGLRSIMQGWMDEWRTPSRPSRPLVRTLRAHASVQAARSPVVS